IFFLEKDHRLVLGTNRFWKIHKHADLNLNSATILEKEELLAGLYELGFSSFENYSTSDLYIEYVYYAVNDTFYVQNDKICFGNTSTSVNMVNETPDNVRKFGLVQLTKLGRLTKKKIVGTFKKIYNTDADSTKKIFDLGVFLYNLDDLIP